MKFVAVTSCPTGIAHTYMAAEAIEQAAKSRGHEIVVETQGAAGSTPIAPEIIAAADAVIFGADVKVRDRDRFAGKPLVEVSVKRAISDAANVIAEAEAAAKAGPSAASIVAGAAGPKLATKVTADAGAANKVRLWLMTGVSYMIPFVAAGGILIALGFMLSQAVWGKEGVVEVTKVDFATVVNGFNPLSGADWSVLLFRVGVAAFGFLVPALAGFIAFAIADRPGIVPGFVGGALAGTVGAGFLGGIAAGIVGGLVALWLSRIAVPKGMRGVMPVVVIPLVATFVTGFVMVAILGRPLKWIFDGMTDWLNGLSGTSAILLGIIVGLMMAFDMGGPINKVAYTFATTGLSAAGATAAASSNQFKVMAAVMAAGMTPPLALALATVLRPKLFNEAERENGTAAWLLGASFITEGAIPFAAADPIRVIPSIMAGSAVTGALSMALGSTSRAPHGGIWVLPLIGRPVLYILAIAAGTAVSAVAVIALKSMNKQPVAA